MRNRCEIARQRPGLGRWKHGWCGRGGGPQARIAQAREGRRPTWRSSAWRRGSPHRDHARGLISLQSNGDGTMDVTVTLSRISNVSGIQLRETARPPPSRRGRSRPLLIRSWRSCWRRRRGAGPLRHVTIRGRIDRYTRNRLPDRTAAAALVRKSRRARSRPSSRRPTGSIRTRCPGTTRAARSRESLRPKADNESTSFHVAHVAPMIPKQFSKTHQTRPHLAVHGPPDSTWEMEAAEMDATIRCLRRSTGERRGRNVPVNREMARGVAIPTPDREPFGLCCSVPRPWKWENQADVAKLSYSFSQGEAELRWVWFVWAARSKGTG